MNALLIVVTMIVFTTLGGLFGWFLGYGKGFDAGYERAIMKPIEYWCPECGALLTSHCSGCPYDTEANRALS